MHFLFLFKFDSFSKSPVGGEQISGLRASIVKLGNTIPVTDIIFGALLNQFKRTDSIYFYGDVYRYLF
jgi:hypothetical protein